MFLSIYHAIFLIKNYKTFEMFSLLVLQNKYNMQLQFHEKTALECIVTYV